MRSKFVENSCASVQMSIRVNSMEVQNDIIVVGEKQWVHSGRVSHAAKGRVLTRGTETGTLHDS